MRRPRVGIKLDLDAADLRTAPSQAGVPGVRALFICPNRKDLSALLVTSLLTMRGGSHENG